MKFPIYSSPKGQTNYQSIILNHPDFRAQYNQIMLDLLNAPLATSRIHEFLNDVESTIGLALQADANNQIPGGVSAHFDSLRQMIAARENNVRTQIQNNNTPLPR